MSFSSDTKQELCKIRPGNCCLLAQVYGMLLFAKSFSSGLISLVTENRQVAACFARLLTDGMGSVVEISTTLAHRQKGVVSCTVTVPDEGDRRRILETFGHKNGAVNRRVNHRNLERDCCVQSFLRGVFLVCGSVTDPNSDYHLEFSIPYMHLAKDLYTLLLEVEEPHLDPGMVQRKGGYVVYLKGSEQITDLLTYLGAQGAAMDFMQIKMMKEVRNYVNRTTNFETANLSKTASAAAEQLKAIRKIESRLGLEALPEELRELASLRLRHPEMSLRELGAALSVPVSRSGVNHRFQRLMEFARSI
jgi:DNA-binding protein WhiA